MSLIVIISVFIVMLQNHCRSLRCSYFAGRYHSARHTLSKHQISSIGQSATSSIVFRQLFEKESSTYTYILADAISKEAIIVDPVLETSERCFASFCDIIRLQIAVLTYYIGTYFTIISRDFQQLMDLGLHLKYVVNTHVHADHVTGMFR